jgi:hypothetical protein
VAALGMASNRAGRIIRRPGVSPAKVAVHRRGHSLVMAKADVLQGNNKVKAWPGAALRGNKGAGVHRGHHPVKVRARVVLRGNKAAGILRAHRPVTAAEVVNKAAVAEVAAAVADEAVKEEKAAVEVVAISRLTVKRNIAPNKRKWGYPTSAAKRKRLQKSQSFRDVGVTATTCKNQPSRRAPAFTGA